MIIVHTARPGVLVGRKGVRIDQLKTEPAGRCATGMTVPPHHPRGEAARSSLPNLVAEVIADALEEAAWPSAAP